MNKDTEFVSITGFTSNVGTEINSIIATDLLVRYFVSFVIVILIFPFSDTTASMMNHYITRKKANKYNVFVISGVLTIIVRFLMIFCALIVAAKISKISTIYILSSLGVLSIVLPLAFTEPLRDFACGVLLITFDKIRVGDYIHVDNRFGRVADIQAFYSKIINPYTGTTTEIPNSKLWTESVQSMYRYKDFKLHMPLLISHRNDIKIVEESIKDILEQNEKVADIKLTYTKQDQRGLVIDIAIGLKDKKSDFGELTSDLYRSLQIGLQERGIVFIDGSRPVSVKYKSNSVTPVIIEETHIEDYMDDTPQPNNFMN
tara:strand:- start:9311 stop:10258 length:948 start_codon:yes stop_codon:yes gene_type:complete